MNYVSFDLEGSLTTQDNAYELMGSFRNGSNLFRIISHYDNILTMEGKDGHEPGDTLIFIMPFLLLHRVNALSIKKLAISAKLTTGIENLVKKLNQDDFNLFCISASYEQFASEICKRLSFKKDNVASTRLPIEEMAQSLSSSDRNLLKSLEKELLQLDSKHRDLLIKQKLDKFFYNSLQFTGIGNIFSMLKPIGGRRKSRALLDFAKRENAPLSKWAVIGDSITDFRMLNEVNKAGGLAIALNANHYAIPYSTMSIASTDISSLYDVLSHWKEGGRKRVSEFVKAKEKEGGKENIDHFHWLLDKGDKSEVFAIHKHIRNLVRKEAGCII